MIDVQVSLSGIKELDERLYGLSLVEEGVEDATRRATELVYERAKANIAAMFRTPGRMKSALRMIFDRSFGGAEGRVEIEGEGYATQEYGGRGWYDIFPVNRLALAFAGAPGGGSRIAGAVRGARFRTSAGRFSAGTRVFAKHVHHPPLPERSYLRSALEEERPAIVELYAAVARRAAAGSR